MVKVLDGPTQFLPPFAKVGVTVIVAIMGLLVLLTGVKIGMLPVPVTLNPIAGESLVQL